MHVSECCVNVCVCFWVGGRVWVVLGIMTFHPVSSLDEGMQRVWCIHRKWRLSFSEPVFQKYFVWCMDRKWRLSFFWSQCVKMFHFCAHVWLWTIKIYLIWLNSLYYFFGWNLSILYSIAMLIFIFLFFVIVCCFKNRHPTLPMLFRLVQIWFLLFCMFWSF